MSRCHAEYRRLVAEQAAVRRVGTLVARGAEPSEVVGAVAEEMRRCVGAFTAGLWRFDTSAEITSGGRRCRSCRACQVACRYSHADRGQHPRNGGAPHRPPREDRQLREHCRGRSPHGCVRSASARRWEFRSSSTAACGDWRPSVPRNLAPCRPTQRSRISRFAELIATALVAGYREEQKRQLLGETSQRPFLIDSLLEGRVRRSLEPVGSRQLSAAAG